MPTTKSVADGTGAHAEQTCRREGCLDVESVRNTGLWRGGRRWLCLGVLLLGLSGVGQVGCTGDPCQTFFQELKKRCRLDVSAEGAKLDQFLNQRFQACQLDLCNRTSINSIVCADPDTHVPGGQNGRFFTCGS